MPSLALGQTNIILNGSSDQALRYADPDRDGTDRDVRVTKGGWAGS